MIERFQQEVMKMPPPNHGLDLWMIILAVNVLGFTFTLGVAAGVSLDLWRWWRESK